MKYWGRTRGARVVKGNGRSVKYKKPFKQVGQRASKNSADSGATHAMKK